MEDKLATAHDLLFHDDQLTFEDRKRLWDLLQYVMSNPKADLAPAKSKLIAIEILKAAQPIQEFVTDLLAKNAAEMSKQIYRTIGARETPFSFSSKRHGSRI
jgi:hypothetical protein